MIKEKELINFAGKDPYRERLNYMHVIDSKAYICDGHRGISFDSTMPNGVYDIKTMQKMDIEPFKGMANILNLRKSGKVKKIINIPEIFGLLKNIKSANKLLVFLCDEGKFHFNKPENFLVALNPIYLRELAGQRVEFYFDTIEPRTSPMLICVHDKEIVIMPKRA